MDLMKMWIDGGAGMPLILAPAMLGALGLGVWQVLAVRGGVAPNLFRGATITLLGAALYCALVGLRLVLGIMVGQGAKPDTMIHGIQIALYPILFALPVILILGGLHLVVILRSGGAQEPARAATTRLRLVATLGQMSAVLAMTFGTAWIILTSMSIGPDGPANPGEYVAMLYRLNTLGLVTAVLAVLLGLATIGLSMRARGGGVSRRTEGRAA